MLQTKKSKGGNAAEPASAPLPGASGPAAGIGKGEFSTCIVLMNRLLTRLSSAPAFAHSGLGVAEWSALSVLAKSGPLSNKQLAVQLGITGQRIAQIIDGLKRSGFVSVTHAVEDTRKNVIALTSSGATQLAQLDKSLAAVLAQALAGRERMLVVTERNLRILTRLFTPPKPDNKPA